jgi:hypothetical protein
LQWSGWVLFVISLPVSLLTVLQVWMGACTLYLLPLWPGTMAGDFEMISLYNMGIPTSTDSWAFTVGYLGTGTLLLIYTHNTVTCRPVSRKWIDKHVSIEIDSWKLKHYAKCLCGYEWSTNIFLDTIRNIRGHSNQNESSHSWSQL